MLDSYFILERLLEYGDTRAVQWVLSQYGDEEIKRVIKTSPRLSPKAGQAPGSRRFSSAGK
ncbi:DUF6922 domain-containing protein [Thermanaeromonas sp.]|uniref:DUF6922 domain-containing protein n=1 Tax=Thermanaeromonas sp. TaxID=2003697 RepID=UPI003D1603BE